MDVKQAMTVITSSLDWLTGLQMQFIRKYQLSVLFGCLQFLFLWNYISQTNNDDDGMHDYVVVGDNEEVGDHT